MSSRQDDGWSRPARLAAAGLALAVIAVGGVGFSLGLQLGLGPVSLVGNGLFVALGVATAYAAATEATWTSLELEPDPFGSARVGEVGFAFDFEDEAA
ncbi:MAG: hypothetical protein ABEJ61_09240 [Haloferacaceae archaeon]